MTWTIQDRTHALKVRQALQQATEELVAVWILEHEHANSPSSGPAVAVSGGSTSDPTFDIVADQEREQHVDRLGRRIAGIVDAVAVILEEHRPRAASEIPPCVNCGQMPGVSHGRCPECGPFFARHGVDRDGDKVASMWSAQVDTRPCRRCGVPVKLSEKKRTCDECRRAG